MRRPPNAVPVLLLASLAASCDDPKPSGYAPTSGPGAPAAEHAPAPSTAKTATATAKKMPPMPPLTEAAAKAVLAAQVATLGGDDESRQVLAYLADLHDRSCLSAVRGHLLERDAKGFLDVTSAAVGAEALLLFGEKDGASTALAVAKQYTAEETDTDEYLLRALARVQGAERAEALKPILDAAAADDDSITPLAVQLLAASGAPEAREVLDRLARDAKQTAQIRGSAAAGLLHLKDARAADVAERLVAGVSAKGDDQVDSQELLLGFGVDGAVEVSPYVRKVVDAELVENDAHATMVLDELPLAIASIHRQGGGADLVPWLRGIREKFGDEYADVTSLALWSIGDDSQTAAAAARIEQSIATWAGVADLDEAVWILDAAAQRGIATQPPFRAIVDTAAQLQAPSGSVAANGRIHALNLAGAHAFLKSSKN